MARRLTGAESNRGVTRRTVLAVSALAGTTAVAGCLTGDGDDVPAPITIEAGRLCDNCTMDIVDYPGPVGQSFYDDPEALLDDAEDRPAQFCSSLCTYAFLFEHEDEQEPDVVYLTDYSTVEYEIDTGGDEPEISSHVDADDFGRADDLTLIADSGVEGAMGASIIGFSDADDAAAFAADYGGDSYEHGEVSQELIMSLM
ncbi:nitrous oxide reductase accessory protein NosL [Halovivax sp.]|uniref:nitrous oxide reductase accessory protein NosL n=1 Tax=Halovivax sp. TaxID=1935978 RepID=UPI0025C39501|nr:nitrous oxide reductase accessory protein NosL [Halovivax sp.]